MPQASKNQRDRMLKWFGSEIDENAPIKFLESRGYKLRCDWLWEKPVPSHTVSDEEFHCLQFLIDEWDFGGIYQETWNKWGQQ